MKRFIATLLFAALTTLGFGASTDAHNVQITQRNSAGTQWVTKYFTPSGQITTWAGFASDLLSGAITYISPNTITVTEASPDTGTIVITRTLNIVTIDEATTLTPSAAGTANTYIILRVINSDGTARAVTVDTGTDFSFTAAASATTEITMRSDGSGWILRGGSPSVLDLGADTTPDGTDLLELTDPTTGAGAKSTVNELNKVVTKFVTGDYTVGTTDSRELYGGILYVTSAGTITVPAYAVGYNFTVITVGAIAVSIDVNAADLLVLDGTALSDGDKITNTSTAGDIAVITDYNSTGFYAATNGWADTN